MLGRSYCPASCFFMQDGARLIVIAIVYPLHFILRYVLSIPFINEDELVENSLNLYMEADFCV